MQVCLREGLNNFSPLFPAKGASLLLQFLAASQLAYLVAFKWSEISSAVQLHLVVVLRDVYVFVGADSGGPKRPWRPSAAGSSVPGSTKYQSYFCRQSLRSEDLISIGK